MTKGFEQIISWHDKLRGNKYWRNTEGKGMKGLG